MTDKAKIKVIKKGEAVPASTPVKVSRSKRETAREMVSTVSTWVSDLQARKRDETKVALEQLFSQSPRPSES
jgi:hypothetical protein